MNLERKTSTAAIGMIERAIVNTVKNDTLNRGGTASHFVRDTGSFVVGLNRDKEKSGEDSISFLRSLDWENVTVDAQEGNLASGACLYYRAEIPEIWEAYEAVMDLEDLTPEMAKNVRLEAGSHRRFDGKTIWQLIGNLEPTRTYRCHLIVGSINGPDKTVTAENAVIYTWYPGRLTPPLEMVEGLIKCEAK